MAFIESLIADPRAFVRRVALYGAAGLVNSLVGVSTILTLDVGFGVDPHLANVIGYVVGIACAFVLNRSMVFKSREKASRTGPRFLIAAGGAFLLNQLVLTVGLSLLGPAPWGRLAAQVAGMCAYTIATFILCQVWVFRERPQSVQAS